MLMPGNSVTPDEPDVVPISADDEVRSRGLLSQIEGGDGTQQQRRLIEFYEIYQASSSPFPPLEVLQEYDRFSPGKGERLFDLCERQVEHRMSQERRGQWMGWLLALAAVALVFVLSVFVRGFWASLVAIVVTIVIGGVIFALIRAGQGISRRQPE